MQRLKLVVVALFAAIVAFGLLAGRHFDTSARTLSLLGVPTGVIASDGDYSNKVALHWDAVFGATNYRIRRNIINDVLSATEVGTTAANYFFDQTAVQGQVYFYWIAAEHPPFTTFSTPDQGMRAFGSITPGDEVLEPPLPPVGNPVTAAKAYLGKTLFWDEQMSSTRTVACGTCHRPSKGGSDPRTAIGDPRSTNPGPDGQFGTLDDIFGSPGVPRNYADGSYGFDSVFGMHEQVTNRKAPSYLNASYSAPNGIFWDGRALDAFRDPLTNAVVLPEAAALESQSTFPPIASSEMGHLDRNWTQVAARIQSSKPLALATNIPPGLAAWIGNRTYPELFEEAFGTPDVTPARIAMAIATHERTLFSDVTPLDRSLYGIEPLTPSESKGRQVFLKTRCDFCHLGPLGTDHIFHNIGVRPQTDDAGRFTVTGNEDDRGSFKTPNLRNVELRAPFMHNGALRTIEDVVEFYDRGGDYDAPNIDHGLIRPLHLTAVEKANLVAFLKRPLTDPRVRDELPPFDRPHLYTESDRVPTV